MADYRVPLKDMKFLLHDVFDVGSLWQGLPRLSDHVDVETADAILDECAKIAEQVVAPISGIFAPSHGRHVPAHGDRSPAPAPIQGEPGRRS